MRRAILIIATLAVGLAVSNPLAAGRATKNVEVDDDFFAPSSLTIKEDNRVRFTWVGENEHNVYKDSGPGPYFSPRTQKARATSTPASSRSRAGTHLDASSTRTWTCS